MATVSYAPRALADLERLCDFLAESDPHAAVRTIDLIVDAVAILGNPPLWARPPERNSASPWICAGSPGSSLWTATAGDENVVWGSAFPINPEPGTLGFPNAE